MTDTEHPLRAGLSSQAMEPQAPPPKASIPDADDYDHEFDGGCYECGGEGFVYDCMTEYACIDPEWGCDMCERVCPLCFPAKAMETGTAKTEGLGAKHDSAVPEGNLP
jgi:hypothetical protein